MIEVEVKDGEGVITTLTLPETVEEISLSDYATFEAKFGSRKQWIKEHNDLQSPLFQLEYLEWAMDCLKGFTGKDIERCPVGDWREHIRKIADGKEFDYSGITGNVIQLLAYINNLVASYKSEINLEQDFEFEYKQEVFTVQAGVRDIIRQQVEFPDIETARVVEALKIWKGYEDSKNDDPNGNFFFTALLHVIACFALKNGETFPTKQNEITSFIRSRVVYFQGLPMTTGLDISRFFFLLSGPPKKVGIIDFSGLLPKGERPAKQSKGRSKKRKRKAKR